MDTRRQILDAALACFIACGYERTTIASIRERSGASNGALFHHFPTKEAIADALYVDAMASYQEGLWELVRHRPRSLRAAVRGAVKHQLGWIEAHQDRARFLYMRGHLEWDSPAGAELQQLNRGLATAYREWMSPLIDSGEVRPMSMLVLTAIVTGPVHAIARRWLAGQVSAPLHSYGDELADAACAALSGTPASSKRRPESLTRRARVKLELLAQDGTVLAVGDSTAELLPASATGRAGASLSLRVAPPGPPRARPPGS